MASMLICNNRATSKPPPAPRANRGGYLLAAAVLGRASLALFWHGLRRPFRPGVLCRATGRVAPR